jgi:two-component system probable response regulator PhcQ
MIFQMVIHILRIGVWHIHRIGGTLSPMRGHVLLVDDDQNLLDGFRRQLRQEPYDLSIAASPLQALALLSERLVDVVVSDERMPEMNGCEFLTEVARLHPATVRLMLTGSATVGAAVQAINQGSVFRFLIKPCLPQELKLALRQALVHRLNQRLQQSSQRSLARAEALIKAVERHSPGLLQRILADPAEQEAMRADVAECASLSQEIAGLAQAGGVPA